MKLAPQNLGESLKHVEETWSSMITDRPFEYVFLDEHFNDLYKSDAQMSTVVSIVAGLAILIACLGLFGLSAITAEQRIKEISIRKVLGANHLNILFLFSKKFTLLLGTAFVLTSPLTYWVLNEWLQNFAYRIDVSWTAFVLAAIISLFITLLTLTYHAMKTANSNPVEALQYE